MGRTKAGRKRRQGVKRTKSGRISRVNQPKGETLAGRPSEWVTAQRARYGNHYSSAIGRAYAAGLLGEGNEAVVRFDTARKFASLHRRVMGGDFYRCALNDAPRGSNDHEPAGHSHQDTANHKWLLDNIKLADESGGRPFLDQLLCKLYTDYGPPWLDSLLSAKDRDRRDTIVLNAALKAIDAMTGEQPTVARIVSQRWA